MGRELVVNDSHEEPAKTAGDLIVTNGVMPRSLIFCPLLLAGSVIGVMTVQSYSPNAYTQNNVESIQALGSYIAVALNNSRISEELRQKANELKLLSKTDPLTGICNRRYIIEKMEDERIRFRDIGPRRAPSRSAAAAAMPFARPLPAGVALRRAGHPPARSQRCARSGFHQIVQDSWHSSG